MRYAGALAVLFLGVVNSSYRSEAAPLKITTMNIEFFGNFTQSKTQTFSSRNQSIKDFFSTAGINADVFAFEEIMDVTNLESGVLNSQYDCHSYNLDNHGHQHVVVCHKKTYDFKIANDDDNYTWEDVSMGGRLRPAVHGILTTKSGKELAHIIAVHLKAMPDQTDLRLEQVSLIAKHITERGDQLPVIMTGDFNTYTDEIDQFIDQFQREGVAFKKIDHAFDYTYRTNRYRSTFDWFLVAGEVSTSSTADVSGPCNEDWHSQTSFDDLTYYNNNVSDHCPVSIEINLDK